MLRYILLFILVSNLAHAVELRSIYKCPEEDGTYNFTDDTRKANKNCTTISKKSLYQDTSPMLDEVDRQKLADTQEKEYERKLQLKNVPKQTKRDREMQKQSCLNAKTNLQSIRNRMKAGYRASESNWLHQRERDEYAKVRLYCRS